MKKILLSIIPLVLAAAAQARLVDALNTWDGEDSSAYHVPAQLSQTGLYDNIASKNRAVTAGIVPYTVNSPLWSDGAHKTRFVQVPVGTKIAPTDTDHYDFPDGTIFVKNFAIDSVYGDSTTRILIETRFLMVRHGDYWPDQPKMAGLSYKWRRDQTDAYLVDRGNGLDTVIQTRWNNRPAGKRWTYPGKQACIGCHAGRGVLGFITPQLHDGKQLKALADAGLLTKDPVAGKANAFRWYALNDKSPNATLEARARSWFGSNCSHCHGNHNEPQGCEHEFEYLKPGADIYDAPHGGYVGKASGSSDSAFSKVINAGHPESSYVMRRITSRAGMDIDVGFIVAQYDANQMPTLATFQIDSAAVPVIRDWICSLAPHGSSCKMPPVAADSTFWELKYPDGKVPIAIRPDGWHGAGRGLKAFFRGRMLVVKGHSDRVKPMLTDLHGRAVPLVLAGENEFRTAAPLQPGAYLLRVGNDVARVNYLP